MHRVSVRRQDEWELLSADAEIMAEISKRAQLSADEDGDEEEDDDSDDEEMEIDAPPVEAGESADSYFDRTKDVWMSQAKAEFPDQTSNRLLERMARELSNMLWSKANPR